MSDIYTDPYAASYPPSVIQSWREGRAAPSNVFGINPTEPTILAADGTNAAKLAGLGYVANPQRAWVIGEYITVNGFTFWWGGGQWRALQSKGAATPTAQYPAEATITASDATNAGRLTALGYIANPLTAWSTGQAMGVGGFLFNWSGTAWAAGAHA